MDISTCVWHWVTVPAAASAAYNDVTISVNRLKFGPRLVAKQKTQIMSVTEIWYMSQCWTVPLYPRAPPLRLIYLIQNSEKLDQLGTMAKFQRYHNTCGVMVWISQFSNYVAPRFANTFHLKLPYLILYLILKDLNTCISGEFLINPWHHVFN